MKNKHKYDLMNILLRYIILLVISSITAFTGVFYRILLPLTIHFSGFLLGLFYNNIVKNEFILVGSSAIEIIPACVAVSAYLLLTILNLTTPMRGKKRTYSLLFSLGLLFVINVLRIFILSVLLINESSGFDVIHEISWYGLNALIVVGIWFLTVYLFKIKNIPVYSDIRNIKG